MSVHVGRMSIVDFCCIRSGEVEFGKVGLVYVTGQNNDSDAASSNASGKSTIYKALTWCLFEECVDGDKADAVIRRGGKSAKVVLPLSRDGRDPMTIKRVRRKGSTKLTLMNAEGEPMAVSKAEAQAIIEDYVGLDFQTFRNTVLYGQNDRSRFADPNTTDGKRKEILRRLLKTTVYQDCLERAREWKASLAKDAAGRENEVGIARSRLSEYDLEAIQEKHDGWETDRQERVDGYLEDAKRHKALATSLKPDSERLDALVEERDAVSEGVQEWKGEGRREELREAMSEAASRRAELGSEVKAGERERARLEGEINRLSDGDCPVCKSPLDGEAPEAYKAGLREVLGSTIEVADANAKARTAAGLEFDGLNAELDHENILIREHTTGIAQVASFERAIASEESALEGVKVQVTHAIEKARGALGSIKDARAEVNPHVDSLATAAKRVEEVKAELEEAETKLAVIDGKAAEVEFWVRGFGSQGIPSLLLDSCMPFLTERSNHYLNTLADGDITVEFSTQRELKSGKGEMRDEIEMKWSAEGVDDATLSGGQLRKVSVAVDLALMDLAASREGEGVKLLALDEVLDGLDAEGRSRVLLLLRELRASRGTVFVTSHDAGLSENFERTINVVKTDGEAMVKETA
ncbi:hypothetical protein LCGC14_0460320 [marine sediment metagenome]|uniref:Rad50/SbcC-type AAA domain-containing protein n=1 Tax=marine sediment metagenome TaxID=412755 RepID=A0A0F9SY35_9ZZZZ